MDATTWNERYRAATVWSGEPNEALVAHVPRLDGEAGTRADASAHRALDLGCGEGADALWLASQGWDVTGVDWAGVALDRAREAAAESGLHARFVEGEATDGAFLASLSPTGTFDLITVGFMHPEPEERAEIFAHLPGLVAPGGHLFVLTHDPEHGSRGFPGPPPHRLLSAESVIEAMDLPEGFEVQVSTVRPRVRDGEVTALDSIVLVRRAG